MKYVVATVAVAVWLYLLHVFTVKSLHAWRFFVGSAGLFAVLMLLFQPLLTEPLARSVAALAGIIGKLTGFYTAYYKYGIIFILTSSGSLTLKIDFECSGVIEIFAFISLLLFFRVYKAHEKAVIVVLGTAFLMVCNALRIALICTGIHYLGSDYYYLMHALVGRLFFYVPSILLYYYVFTRTQVLRTKVGIFTYGHA